MHLYITLYTVNEGLMSSNYHFIKFQSISFYEFVKLYSYRLNNCSKINTIYLLKCIVGMLHFQNEERKYLFTDNYLKLKLLLRLTKTLCTAAFGPR